MKSQQTFMVEVTFYSSARKTVPEAGYRPHFVMELDEEQEYLGVEIYDIEVDTLDSVGYAMCFFYMSKRALVIVRFSRILLLRLWRARVLLGEGR
ncbi:hypothetical protein HB799_10050 [Listeria welshimeri]|nr:hypothetical protein [Listeria welshimeri]